MAFLFEGLVQVPLQACGWEDGSPKLAIASAHRALSSPWHSVVSPSGTVGGAVAPAGICYRAPQLMPRRAATRETVALLITCGSRDPGHELNILT